MTNSKLILAAAAFAALGAPSIAAPAAPAASTPAASAATVKINGLICDFCVQALTRTFKRQAAVRDVVVDLDAKEVRLGFKAGASLDDATIGRLVRDAGYNLVSIARRAA